MLKWPLKFKYFRTCAHFNRNHIVSLPCSDIESWMKPEAFVMLYNILHHLAFRIAFATKVLSPFALITVALGRIHQVPTYLQVFILLFSLPLKLFIRIVTGLASIPLVSHQLKYSLWKGFACPLFKVIHLSPWFILLVAATTGIILHIYVSISCLSHWSPWFEGQEAGGCLLLCFMTGSKWSTKCVKLNWTLWITFWFPEIICY